MTFNFTWDDNEITAVGKMVWFDLLEYLFVTEKDHGLST